MVWVVSRIRFKVETLLTKSHTSINSWLNQRQRSRWRGPHHERQPAHQLIEHPSTLIADYGREKKTFTQNKNQNYNLYILVFIFLHNKLEDKRLCTEWQQALPDFNLLLISSWKEFWFGRVVPKYLNCSTLSKDLLSTFNVLILLSNLTYRHDHIFSVFTSRPISLLATTKWHDILLVNNLLVCLKALSKTPYYTEWI